MGADGPQRGDECDQVSRCEQQICADAEREPQRTGDGVEQPGTDTAQEGPYRPGQSGAGLRHGDQDDYDGGDGREADEQVSAWCDLEAAQPGSGEQPED